MSVDKVATYYSGVSKVLLFLLCAVLLVLVLPVATHGNFDAKTFKIIGFSLFIFLFLLHLMYNTSYTINPKYLLIRVGFFNYKPIPIISIHRLMKTKSLISGPVASFNRIEIRYNKFDSIVISPKDRESFVNHLLEINPKIQADFNDF